MALGTNQMTITTHAKFIPELWSQFIIRAREKKLVMGNSVLRVDKDVKAKGQILHLPQLSHLTANVKAANTQVTLNATTETEVKLTVDTHIEASFLVEDILEAQADYNLMKEYSKDGGYAVAKKMDTDLINLQSSLTQTAGAAGVDITDEQLLAAIQKLDEADAPDEDRSLVILPAQKVALLKIDKFVRADSVPYEKGKSPIQNGIFGEIYATEVKSTTNLPAGVNLLFHKECFGLGVQKNQRVQSQYKLEYLGTLVVVDLLYGVKIIRNDHGVVISS